VAARSSKRQAPEEPVSVEGGQTQGTSIEEGSEYGSIPVCLLMCFDPDLKQSYHTLLRVQWDAHQTALVLQTQQEESPEEGWRSLTLNYS
jgi:hypothetical protein